MDSRLNERPLLAGVEAGGTKFVCALGTGPDDLRASIRIETTSDDETLGRVVEFFEHESRRLGNPAALGIASFGPVDLDRSSPTWGHLTTTPKAGWANVDIAGELSRALDLPTGFDTDVAGAALAEHRWGAGRGVSDLVYVTVGTGIGGGALVRGRPVHGLVHPEMGHMLLPRHPRDLDFPGICPFHGDCLEGLASGPAIEARWSTPAERLPADHPAWEIEAHYLGGFAANLVLTLSPQRLIFGGGVCKAPGLLPRIRRRLTAALAGYISAPAIQQELDRYLVAPELGDRAGVAGALALAEATLEPESQGAGSA